MASFVTDNYKLDITPQGNYPVVYMSQFENGRQIQFRILNRGISYTIPSGVSAFVSGLKSNGGYYEHVCEIDSSRRYVVMPIESDMTDVNGRGIANIVFTNSNSEKVISAKFIIHTQQTVSDSGIEVPTEAETVFQQLLNEIRASAAEIDADIDGLQATLQAGIANVTENTNNAISVLNSRMDTFIADHGGNYRRVVLWTSQDANGIIAGGTTVTLSEAVENFDYIEIYGMNTDNDVVETIPVDDILADPGYAVRSVNISATSIRLRVVESRITISGTTFTIANQYLFNYDDSTLVRQITQNNKDQWVGQFGIMKIVGRKMVGNTNTEVVDIRVGADGTIYSTAGDAVRAQASKIVGTCLYIGEVPSSS